MSLLDAKTAYLQLRTAKQRDALTCRPLHRVGKNAIPLNKML